MFNNPLLEAAAANKNDRQQLDRLLETVPRHERMALACFGLVLAAFVVWAFLGRVDRVVNVDGILLQPGVRHALVATEPGFLTELLVSTGDVVEAGNPIARQTVPVLDREYAALRERVALLRDQSGGPREEADPARLALEPARAALLQLEARRRAGSLIVSAVGGVVGVLRVVPGDYLPAGAVIAEVREERTGPPVAVLRVSPDVAQGIEPGMTASVSIAAAGDTPGPARGRVASVTAGAMPGGPVTALAAVAAHTHEIEVVLEDASVPDVPDGTPCSVRIVIGREPPAALFARGAR